MVEELVGLGAGAEQHEGTHPLLERLDGLGEELAPPARVAVGVLEHEAEDARVAHLG